MDVPRNVHKKFHTALLRPAAIDPLPSQQLDDSQPPPILNDEGDKEWQVEQILRAKWVRVGRGRRRLVLVKWVGFAEPTWQPIEDLQDTLACERFEEAYGDIMQNDGPANDERERGGNVTGCAVTAREACTLGPWVGTTVHLYLGRASSPPSGTL